MLFKVVNDLLYREKDTSLPSADSKEELANKIADFFAKKIERIVSSFVISESLHVQSSQEFTGTPFTKFQPISEDKLREVIMSGNSKCCHLDPIPTSVLKEVLDHVLPTLTTLVNKSLQESYFPHKLKSASVVPLLKKSTLDKEELKNYRPVSNLPYISKLIEKVAVQQLKAHMDNNLLHEACQSAYRSCHSTETALLKITSDLRCAMEEDYCVLLVMLDLSAVFDTVSHETLLQRMEKMYGVQEEALAWLSSYFTDRSQSVIIQDSMSAPKPLKTGLPQRSILGPFAFPSYSSPLFKIARQHGVEMHMYADDMQLYLPFKPEEYNTATSKMQDCLASIRSWMSQNQLKFMIIGKPNSLKDLPPERKIKIGDEYIVATDTAKNIGVVLDSQLHMDSQINSICRSSYMYLHFISKIKPFLTPETVSTLVHALVTSRLDNLLSGCYDYLLKRLQMVHNCAARLILGRRKYDRVTPMLAELHWLPVKERIIYKICLFVSNASTIQLLNTFKTSLSHTNRNAHYVRRTRT